MLGFLRCLLRFDFQNSLQDYLDCVAYTHNHRICLHNDRQSKISQTATLVCSILSIANRDTKPPLMFSQHDVDLESIPFFYYQNTKIDIKSMKRKFHLFCDAFPSLFKNNSPPYTLCLNHRSILDACSTRIFRQANKLFVANNPIRCECLWLWILRDNKNSCDYF